MGKDEVLVYRDEFMEQMIKCIGSEEWKKRSRISPRAN